MGEPDYTARNKADAAMRAAQKAQSMASSAQKTANSADNRSQRNAREIQEIKRQMATHGTLKLHVEEARLERDVEMFGAMDPYVTIEYRMQRMRTKTHGDAGKTTKWNQCLDIDVKYIDVDTTASLHPRALGQGVGLRVNLDIDPWVVGAGIGYRF